MTLKRAAEASLVVRDARVEPWREPDWQKLWLAVQARTWASLALVPGGQGADPSFTLEIAAMLARTGMMHLGTPIQVADATRVPLTHLVQFGEELRRLKRDGGLVLIALAAASENPITVSLAQSVDCALLCVLLEKMTSSESKKTIDQIGAGRFLGSAVFHPPKARG